MSVLTRIKETTTKLFNSSASKINITKLRVILAETPNLDLIGQLVGVIGFNKYQVSLPLFQSKMMKTHIQRKKTCILFCNYFC